jgi:hypothetical protein
MFVLVVRVMGVLAFFVTRITLTSILMVEGQLGFVTEGILCTNGALTRFPPELFRNF